MKATTSYRSFKTGIKVQTIDFLSHYIFTTFVDMKIKVTAKPDNEEKPARGFIELPGFKLLVFTNATKQITKFELTLNKKLHVFKDEHPYIMWCEVENTIDAYLNSIAPKETTKAKTLSLPRHAKRIL